VSIHGWRDGGLGMHLVKAPQPECGWSSHCTVHVVRPYHTHTHTLWVWVLDFCAGV